MTFKYILTYVFVTFVLSISSFSQTIQLSESAKVSLLTNSPWDKEVYALFGHTALRVSDETNNIDIVFNYGLFDFNSSNFMYRFVKGETDYMVGAIPYVYYINEYNQREVSTLEQVLNLTHTEKQKIWDALCINSLPVNRVYRYNFFFDNCSTRPRDIVEKNINGTIQYTTTNREQSFRDLLYTHLDSHTWTKFGIDLVIGSEADREATEREKMFLPRYLEKAYEGAIIKNTDGSERKLVDFQHYLSHYPSTFGTPESYTPDYPFNIGCILLFVCIFVSIFTYRKKLLLFGKIFDTLLFIIAGIAGCIIAFLMFVSVHPATFPNWNIVWLNPLQLIAAMLFFSKTLSKYIYYYHFINFAFLSLFMLLWFLIPQQLEIAFLPFVLSLWLRSGTNFVQYKRKKYIRS